MRKVSYFKWGFTSKELLTTQNDEKKLAFNAKLLTTTIIFLISPFCDNWQNRRQLFEEQIRSLKISHHWVSDCLESQNRWNNIKARALRVAACEPWFWGAKNLLSFNILDMKHKFWKPFYWLTDIIWFNVTLQKKKKILIAFKRLW